MNPEANETMHPATPPEEVREREENAPTSETPPRPGTPPPPQMPRGGPGRPPQAPAPRMEPEKTRRVGTLTMGIALILAGVCALLALFYPGFDIITVAKFSPAVLIVLGAEILINSLIFRGQKLRYDFLSAVVCFLLICGSVSAVALPSLFLHWGPQRMEMMRSVEKNLDDLTYEALATLPTLAEVGNDVYLNGELAYQKNAGYEILQRSDHVATYLRLAGSYPTKEAFAADCLKALNLMAKLPFSPDRIEFTCANTASDSMGYQLNLKDPLARKLDVSRLAALTEDNEQQRALETERQRLEEERSTAYSELEQERQSQQSEVERQYSELESNANSQNEEIASQWEELNEAREQFASEQNQAAPSQAQ